MIVDDMVRSAQRGWDILLAAAVPLLIGGLVWTGLNIITGFLLTGPALVGLFAVALKAHQGRSADPADLFSAFDDVAAPLVAGFGFILPFKLADYLAAGVGSLPVVATVLLAVWFALGMQVFAALADRPDEGLAAALRRARTIAERGPSQRLSGLAQHLIYGIGVYLLIGLGLVLPGIGGFTLVITAPAAVCLLTAWHARAALPSEAAAEPRALPETEGETPGETTGETPASPRKPRKKTPSRRPATTDEPEE